MEKTLATLSESEYLKLAEHFDENGLYEKFKEEFYQLYPDFPLPKPVDSLDLILKKDLAKDIISGKKKLEVRLPTRPLARQLTDLDVANYESKVGDSIPYMYVVDFSNDLRPVKTIHFHDTRNTWFVDVECIKTVFGALDEKTKRRLQDTFCVPEEDMVLFNDSRANGGVYYFILGKVLGTNLK